MQISKAWNKKSERATKLSTFAKRTGHNRSVLRVEGIKAVVTLAAIILELSDVL